MLFLYNNVAPIAVGVVVSVLAWLFGGHRGDLLLPVVPWLFAFMVEVVCFFPQRHRDETTYDARERVWRELRCSPVSRVALGLFALLLIPLVNNGLCPTCDAAKIAEGISPAPAASFLPFCVNRLDQLEIVMWFAMALVSLLAVHLCLTRSGKRLVIELIVWNGAALAVLGFVQGAMDAPGPFWCELAKNGKVTFFSTFGYPNTAGDYFTTLFGLSVALWRDRYEQLRREDASQDPSELAAVESKTYGRFWRRHYFLLPAAVFFFAAINTLSRAAIILVSVSATLYFFHTLIVLLSRMPKSRRVFVGVWSMVVFALVIFFSTVFMPSKIQKEVDTLETRSMLDRVTGRGQYHIQVATEIWKDHPLFGCGGWGYRHFCVPKMRELEIDLKQLQKSGGINVHNDYLQFLAEHGLVGFGAMALLVVLLLWPVCSQWRATVTALRFKKGKDLPPRPIQIFALPSAAFCILVTAVCTLVHGFSDCPLRSCAVLTLFYVSLAALPGFMPKYEHSFHRHHHHHQ